MHSVDQYLSGQTYDYEILAVNDGSTDKTSEVLSNLKTQISKLKVINNKENQGKGWVVRQGMLQATGDIRLFMDADNSTTIDQVVGMLPFLEQGYDIVVGSRRIKGASIAVKQPFWRDLLGSLFRFIVRLLVPVDVTDSQTGFKVFSQKAAETIFPRQTIFRWAFDVEILTLARRFGFKIKEMPIVWMNDKQSHVTLKGMINMLLEILHIRLNLMRGTYAKRTELNAQRI